MLATYGVDTLDPAVTLRRVRVLSDRLPPGRWPDPEHPASWTTEAYLLAQLIDEIAALHYSVLRAVGGKPNRPQPFTRPKAKSRAVAPPQQPRTSWGALADALTSSPSGVVVHGG